MLKVTDSPCFEKGPEFVWVLKTRKFLIGLNDILRFINVLMHAATSLGIL